MSGPDPVVATARRAVREALADLEQGSLVLVACSGGADSTALAAATAFVAPRVGLRAGAVVVDHGMQAGSDDVAGAAAERCRGLGLDPVEVRRVDVGRSGAGPEADARAVRYAALDASAQQHGAHAVLLGHTLDDQAETVLLGLARGAGARSLAGMAPRRTTRGSLLCRPFLALRRADTEAVCRALGLDWWDDPTNGADGHPLRSRVRSAVVPALVDVLGPGAVPGLARTADLLRDDADLLDTLAAELLGRALVRGTEDDTGPDAVPDVPDVAPTVVLDVEVLGAAHPALRRRALRTAAVRAGSPAGDVFAVHVEALDALVTAWHGQGAVHLPGDRRATRACGRLSLGSR
ncbi:tRNA lysidine(34) synthetase TilS [Cellulosimicrobium terreum]|nr:tRNA lysidine(34) synthetase TilS [Cellulosimicrobium terreum]